MAFEADIPAIEGAACNRITGAGCTNPPAAAAFYPIYTTGHDLASESRGEGEDRAQLSGCVWQFGGGRIAGTTNRCGGSPTTEFGSLLALTYPLRTGPQAFLRGLPQRPAAQPLRGGNRPRLT